MPDENTSANLLAAPRTAADSRNTVLVAEDESDMRATLATALQREGYRVISVANGVELYQELQRGIVPSLIISDERMPGFTGTEVLRWMRKFSARQPAVLITAFSEDENVAEAESLGVAILTKPFELSDLLHLARWYISPGEAGRVAACSVCGGARDLRALAARDGAFVCGFCRLCAADLEFEDDTTGVVD